MSKLIKECPYLEQNCVETNCPCAKYKAYLDANDEQKVKAELNVMGLDMDEMGKFELLMSMQKLFEMKFHDVDNMTKEDMDLWINRYLVCIEDEVREVREHLNIYPDKPCKTNKEELKKEIIDILHFIMDAFICSGATYKDIEQAYLKEFYPNIKEVNDLIEFAFSYQTSVFERFSRNMSYDYVCLLLVNELLDCSAMVRQCISWKHWKKPSNTIDMRKLYKAFAHMFKTFIWLCEYNYMSPEDIKNVYVKKNLENRFRQQHGY